VVGILFIEQTIILSRR